MKHQPPRVAALLVALAVAALVAQRPAPPALRAGVAKVDITPTATVALEGYSNAETRLSEGVHDRLYARAFALSAGEKRLVLVSGDLSGFRPGPYYQRIVCDRLGLRPEEVWLCGTHTHSGPALTLGDYPHPNNLAYSRRLEQQLVEVVASSLRHPVPVRLVVTRGRSTIAGSRRKPVSGAIEMAFNPEGKADHEVLALQLQRPGGNALGILFNYSSHSRSLRAPNRLVSGDVFGIAEQRVEAKLARGAGRSAAAPAVGAFPGASGDIDPIEVVDGFDEPAPGTPPAPVRLGEQLGQDVLDALAASPEPSTPQRSNPSGPSVARPAIVTAARRVLLPQKSGPPRPMDVLVARVGDVAFVGLECEAVVEIGLAIKAGSPFRSTFVFTICNVAQGYLPVAHQYDEGGYEVAHTAFGQGAAELLVKETLGALQRIK